MAQRFYITLGATTSAGGRVTSASSGLALNGARTALEGDSVWCESCASNGVIALDAPREGARDNGRQHALSGDLCLCRCDPPPRLVARQQGSILHGPAPCSDD